MENQLKLSIITVNYNGLINTEELIQSLVSHLTITYEIIVVDNGSEKNESTLLSEKFPFIKAIRSENNLGFAGGNNLGMKHASGKYFFFLNNDTIINNDNFHFLIDFLEKNPLAGGVSPKILFTDPLGAIQFVGYTPLSQITLRNKLIGYLEQDLGQHDVPRQTPYLHGAAMLVKKEVIDAVGPMPEIFFLYYEELDWCSQITSFGYQLWCQPQATVYHKESSSTGKSGPLKTYYTIRNRLLFAWRNRSGPYLYLSIIYQVVLALPKRIIVYLWQGDVKQALTVCRGCRDFFTLIRQE